MAYAGTCCAQVGQFNFVFLINIWNTRTAATNISCPTSTPTLKKSSARGISVCGSPISESAPANPKPCSKPKLRATSQGALEVRPISPRCCLASSVARKRMESAITASTGVCGTWIKPSAAMARVTLWARVKAVIVLTKRLVLRTINSRPNTKSRWSKPPRMCSTPRPR